MSNGSKTSQSQSQYNNSTFDEIDKEAADQARFIKPVEGQNLVLQFYPNRTEIKEVDFQKDGNVTKRVNFIVTDATGKLDGEKEISFGLATAKRIINLIRRGYNRLEVVRYGSGLNTRYDFIPVQQ
jgi:hypothetical protein